MSSKHYSLAAAAAGHTRQLHYSSLEPTQLHQAILQ